MSSKIASDKSQKLRLIIQTVFLLVSIYLFYGLISGVFCTAHSFCPYSMVCFGLLRIAFWKNMLFVFSAAIVSGLLICITTMFIGRKFCGYICPLGTIQEFLFKLRSNKYRRNQRISFFYEKKFGKLTYMILGITVFLVLIRKSPFFMSFCPILTIGQLPYLIIPGILIWIFIIIGGLLTERFFCRFLCPYGALLNVFQFLSKLFGFKRLIIKRNLESCVDCCNCMKNCPMNINLAESEYINDANCIHCLICTIACPKENCITEELTNED